MIANLHAKYFKTRYVVLLKPAILILLLVLTLQWPANAQAKEDYEEVSVILNVSRIGSVEIPAIINGQMLYLSVTDVFNFLKIRNIASSGLDSISGFFINPKATFLIDKANKRIVYQDAIFKLKSADLLRTETTLYLKSEYFGEVFGLECNFSFRNLSVTLNTKIELPVVREMQQELMRRNIGQLQGEKKADTSYSRSFPSFHFGTADWLVIATQTSKSKNYFLTNLNLGGIVARGETDVSLNYNTNYRFDLKQQFYRWRLVNNERKALRQITLGKTFVESTSSLFAPVTGIQLSNTPTTFRRSFGTYRLSNTTEPGWTVELYVNNVLVNYMKADASGFFTFEVPMVYGNSVVTLRFYGPWGEERVREQNISIPFNFLPLHQFEYNFTAGFVGDNEKRFFSRFNFNYGLGKRITVGGGGEYLSSLISGKMMPFLNTSVRLGSGLLISGEHTYGVRTKAIVNYSFPSNLQIDLNYTKYNKNQTAIPFNYLEERKAVLSIPFQGKKFNAFSRLTLNQITVPKLKFTTAEFLMSATAAGISSNFTTNAIFTNSDNPLVYSNLAMTFSLPFSIRFIPQVQYEYNQKIFSRIRSEVEKNFFNNSFINLSYEYYTINKFSFWGIGFRYNLPFAQTSFSSYHSNKTTTTVQSARGSLVYDNASKYFNANNQSNVGKGGIIILPYLDINCNGLRDANEPKVFGIKLKINGGRIDNNDRDTTIRVLGLEAYTKYFIELDKNSFDNIAWQIKKPIISVTVQPNYFQQIEVPVAVVGEVSGYVYLNESQVLSGLGRIIINFYNRDSILVARTLTESDGFFNFLGLAPGAYTASIDTSQLLQLKMSSVPLNIPFVIKPDSDGDFVEGMKFVLLK